MDKNEVNEAISFLGKIIKKKLEELNLIVLSRQTKSAITTRQDKILPELQSEVVFLTEVFRKLVKCKSVAEIKELMYYGNSSFLMLSYDEYFGNR